MKVPLLVIALAVALPLTLGRRAPNECYPYGCKAVFGCKMELCPAPKHCDPKSLYCVPSDGAPLEPMKCRVFGCEGWECPNVPCLPPQYCHQRSGYCVGEKN